MRVCVVGGGHIGTTLACYIKHNDPAKHVSLFTRRPERFSEFLKCNDIEKGTSYTVKLDCISSNPSVAVGGSDIIFIALPHFAVEKAFKDIAPYAARDAFIGVLPGGGGCEFFFHKYFPKTNTLFGFQRVPFTSKLVEYGHETNLKSWKPFSVVGVQKVIRLNEACERIEMCGLPIRKAPNYLSIALTPTNPILHTSRTYEIFGGHDRNYEFDHICKFYVGWTDEASKTLLTMDAELHSLLNEISELDTDAVRPLTEHYEAPTIEAMTEKINSIPTFQTVNAPMKIKENNSYIADTASRMFTEDFPWGLMVIRSYFDYFNITAPKMDELLRWYANYMKLDWYREGKLCGNGLKDTGHIGRYGIKTKEDLIAAYVN